VSLLFARACLLDQLGRSNEARDAYIEFIKRDGTHIGALGNMGALPSTRAIAARRGLHITKRSNIIRAIFVR
jgi:hypothetical protein